ncbi:MAG: HEPN domain-containing protein [Candidatus Methanoperedens sp.]|nr:HEPN domain-containing protein [Candidatus Methanoperedens sp.]MCZ7395643.1 HEPN domain-containing protein [Candidatus Methanoperedens sp.]
MKSQSLVEEWLKRANSNLFRAKLGKVSEEVLYEDLCFDCEQAVEKSIKALLVQRGVPFPKTHSIAYLIELIEDSGLDVSDEIKEAVSLTAYAVGTRYPGEFEPVDEREYLEALKIAE